MVRGLIALWLIALSGAPTMTTDRGAISIVGPRSILAVPTVRGYDSSKPLLP